MSETLNKPGSKHENSHPEAWSLDTYFFNKHVKNILEMENIHSWRIFKVKEKK